MEKGIPNNIVKYLNMSILCKLAPSKISGVGVIAIQDIAKGELITEHNRRNRWHEVQCFALTESDLMMLNKPVRDLILDKTIYDSKTTVFEFMSPNYECFLQDFCNHSDDPNIDIYGRAIKDIKAGEEIVEDFRAFFGKDTHPLLINHLKDVCKF